MLDGAAEDERWKAQINPLNCGGPQSLTIKKYWTKIAEGWIRTWVFKCGLVMNLYHRPALFFTTVHLLT